jgi:uncharacterized protein (DUF3084 family)
MARTKAEQLVKASEKYPEPLNPESWTGEQLADHAFQEVFDLTSYITGMKIKFEKMNNDLDFHKEMNEHVQDLYNYKEKAFQAVIRQAQYWKKEYEEIVDILQANIEKEIAENWQDKWATASYDADMFKQQRDRLQELLDRANEDISFIGKQKTELMNSNHRVAEQNKKLEREINQLYADNKTLETCVKDLQVEAKLWKDKFHLIKPLEEDKHVCKEHAVGVYVMSEIHALKCDYCGKTLWSKDNE